MIWDNPYLAYLVTWWVKVWIFALLQYESESHAKSDKRAKDSIKKRQKFQAQILCFRKFKTSWHCILCQCQPHRQANSPKFFFHGVKKIETSNMQTCSESQVLHLNNWHSWNSLASKHWNIETGWGTPRWSWNVNTENDKPSRKWCSNSKCRIHVSCAQGRTTTGLDSELQKHRRSIKDLNFQIPLIHRSYEKKIHLTNLWRHFALSRVH